MDVILLEWTFGADVFNSHIFQYDDFCVRYGLFGSDALHAGHLDTRGHDRIKLFKTPRTNSIGQK